MLLSNWRLGISEVRFWFLKCTGSGSQVLVNVWLGLTWRGSVRFVWPLPAAQADWPTSLLGCVS